MADSYLERLCAAIIKDAGFPIEPIREYRLFADRRFRCDFAFITEDKKICLEVDGSIWTGGRHTRGQGYQTDCEKFNRASLDGWIVLRVTKKHIENGQMIEWLKQALL